MDEYDIENHPDLMDPDWQRRAEKEAWLGLRRSRRRARRRNRVTIAAGVVVVLAAAGGAFYVWGRATAEQYTGPESVASGTTAPAASTTAAGPTDLPTAASVDLSRPFDKTPAQNWLDGIAGLTIAPAKAVGSFSAKQVGQAEAEVKQAITVAQFDQDTLAGHKSAAYVGLFAPDARADIQAHAQDYETYLADGYRLLPVPPRMTGTMTARPGKPGELVVHVAYVVAYAFDPGGHPVYGHADIDPFVRVDADYTARSGSHWAPTSRGLWLDTANTYFTSIACDSVRTSRLTPAFGEPDYAAPYLTRDPGQFDPHKPMPTEDNCHE